MANLFNNNILKEKLEDFEISWFDDKIAIIKQRNETYKKWTLQKMSEKEVEQSYNEEILGKVLGYTNFPANPFTRQPQPKTEATGQKPDFWLGFYYQEAEKKDKTLAVIEVKDAKTDINKSQKREGNFSPVQQGFKYQRLYSGCKWVIVSNFFETKLLVDVIMDYEIWTLETLLDETDNYFQFKKFYYLLCAENLIKETGKSKIEDLLTAVRIQEEQITKAFYKEYKWLRHELINDLIANNKMYSVTTLVEKAQKIIDRIVFIHFCEDTKEQLLPNGKLAEVIEYWEKALATTRQILCNFFEVVNSGSDKLNIPNWYNGGLFKHDSSINWLKVWDSICKKFVELGKYDFSEDISVNILGHVFEQSISDLEEIKAQLLKEKGSSKADEMKQNKRKKDWIFYTPEYIVDYIVSNSLGKYLEEKFDECSKQHKNEFKLYQAYQQILQNVKVLDPACGSGAFLVKVFDFLLEENIRVMKILSGGDTGMFDINAMSKEILQNNIFWVDLNDESVEITKLSLWLKTAKKGKKLATLDNNIKCGNSLIDDPAVAGDKAFDWNMEFKDIMDNDGFDVIVGNPPYGATISKNDQEFYIKKYQTSAYKLDTYSLFIEKGLDILKKLWFLSYITPYTWLSIQQHKKLREKVISYALKEIIDLPVKVFDDADLDTVITIIQNTESNENISIGNVISNQIFLNKKISLSNILKNENLTINLYFTDDDEKIIAKIKKDSKIIHDYFDVSQWLIPYDKYRWHTPEQIKKRVFHSTEKVDETYKKEIRGEDVSRYTLTPNNNLFIKYWKNLAAPREAKFFNGERLLIREITRGWYYKLFCTYAEDELYNTPVIINIVPKKIPTNSVNLKYLLSLINSKLYTYFHIKVNPKASAKTSIPKILVNDVRQLPVKEISTPDQQPFIQKADQMLSINKEFQEKIDSILKFVQQKYNIEKLSKKLQHFYEYDFKTFQKQLKIKKISIEDERQLMTMFDKDKAEILELKQKIDATDREIDEMVYKLYGLTDEEIKVVETSK